MVEDSLLVKIERDCKVMEDVFSEGSAEEQVAVIDVAEEHQGIGVLGILVKEGASL